MKANIIEDFLCINENGLYCAYGDFYLDAKRPVRQVVVSHGHGDHVVAGCHQVWCTGATRSFMEHRFRKNAGYHFHIMPYGVSFDIQDVSVTLLPAGHILGSAMVLMEYRGLRYLYTGDYKLQADPTCEPIQLVKADVLITESTFADPAVVHPDPIAEISKLNETDYPILLGAYALGKAQRLTALINQYCPVKRVFIHHAIMPFHKLYEASGVEMLCYLPYARKVMKDNPEHAVYIVPPLTFNSYAHAKNIIRVFASGWKNLQVGKQMSLFISDHVDWQDILYTVATVEPQEIWTLHGDGRALRDHYLGNITVKLL